MVGTLGDLCNTAQLYNKRIHILYCSVVKKKGQTHLLLPAKIHRKTGFINTLYNVTRQRNFNKGTDKCTMAWEQSLHRHYLVSQHSREREQTGAMWEYTAAQWLGQRLAVNQQQKHISSSLCFWALFFELTILLWQYL